MKSFAGGKGTLVVQVALLLMLVSCASYVDETKTVRDAYRFNDYQRALTNLEKSELKGQARNALLYNLEKAMILDRLNERVKSRATLLEADRIADRLYTVSITKTAASFVVNDSMSDYDGEDYEKVAIHTMLALSFIEDQDYAAARVEAAKINSKLHEITQEYDERYANYKEDAFARYLSAVVYEAQGDLDDALIDYKTALALYSGHGFRKFYSGTVPKALVTALYRIAKKRRRTEISDKLKADFGEWTNEADGIDGKFKNGGDVVVVHQYGQIAIKTAKEFILPISNQIVRFSFPYIQQRWLPPRGSDSGVIANETFEPADNAAHMDAIAYHVLEDRRGRLIAKGIARLLVKGQLTEQAYKNFGPIGGLLANAVGAITETADTRSWTLLPQAFYISRVRLSAGKHTIQIKTAGKLGRIESIDVKDGSVHIFRDVNS